MPFFRLGITWNGEGQNHVRIFVFQMKHLQGGESIKTEGTAAEKASVTLLICVCNAVSKTLLNMFCFGGRKESVAGKERCFPDPFR